MKITNFHITAKTFEGFLKSIWDHKAYRLSVRKIQNSRSIFKVQVTQVNKYWRKTTKAGK